MENTPTQKNEDQFGSYYTADDHIEEYPKEPVEQLQSGWYVQLKQLPINCEDGFFYWGVSEYDDGWHKQWQEVVREKPEAFALCFTLQSAKSLVKILQIEPRLKVGLVN